MTVRVKICGITNLHDALLCIDAGADSLGFVTEYPIPVPWNLKRDKTRMLISKLPPFISSTVVTTGNLNRILEIARETHPDVIQLHGEEKLSDIGKAVDALEEDGIRIIKALSIDVDSNKAYFEVSEPLEAVHALQESGVDAMVLDSRTRSKPAGTGVPLSWKIAREIRDEISIPVILAGGLTRENVGNAIEMVNPYAVDVITGVEASPGDKDPEKVRGFIEAAKGCGESIRNHNQVGSFPSVSLSNKSRR
jgi:phosphoribosylanthranilate isomerase